MKAENIKLYKQLEEMLLHKYEQLGLDEFGREREGLGSIFTFLKQKATSRDVGDEKFRIRITQELLAAAKPEQNNLLEGVKRDEEKKEAQSGQTEIKKNVSSSSTTTENYVSDEEFNRLLLQYLNDNYYFSNDRETLGKYHYLILNSKPQLGIDFINAVEKRAQSSSSTFNRENLINNIVRDASSETKNLIWEAFKYGLTPIGELSKPPHP